MGLENTSALLQPKILEAGIIEKYHQVATGKGLLYYNKVASDVIETMSEGDTKGDFETINKDNGIPPYIQTIYKKAPRTMQPYSASIEVTQKEALVQPNIVLSRIRVAGSMWADYADKMVYSLLESQAGLFNTPTAWSDTSATPVNDVSYAISEIADESGLQPDTLVVSNKSFHYLAVATGLTKNLTFTNDTNAYAITGKLADILGLRILRTKNVGDQAYVLKTMDCGKWDSFLDPVTYTYTDIPGKPLLQSMHTMLEWGAPTLVMPKLVYKLTDVGVIPET